MISTRKMLQNTSRSFIHKYSLIAIMAEYISRLSAIVMQLVREFQVTAIDFENFIRLTHFGIAYWFFSPAEKLRISVFFIFFSPLPLSVRVLLNVESAKHEIQFSKWYKKKGIQLRNPFLAVPLFLCEARKLHFSERENLNSRRETFYFCVIFFPSSPSLAQQSEPRRKHCKICFQLTLGDCHGKYPSLVRSFHC